MPGQINFALLAHVDAGKTTLSEAILYLSGVLRRTGRVDNRDTFLDTDAQERDRGITIYSKTARFSWKGTSFTLLDTPGHADLSGEMERTLPVLDAAVLLVSGTDGIQSHTRTLWSLLERYRIPTFFFLNKLDRPDVDTAALLASLRGSFSDGIVAFSEPDATEQAALCDDAALQEYTDTLTLTDATLQRLVKERKLFPCFAGSALKQQGIGPLLDKLAAWVPVPEYPERFSARVFKISRDRQDTRLTWMKVTGGALHTRDLLSLQMDGRTHEEKADRILLFSGEKTEQTDLAPAGTVCAVTGLEHTYAGQTLGMEQETPGARLEGVFSYRVNPQGYDPHTLLAALRRLEEEDPLLHVRWNEALREIRLNVMGEVQLEVLTRRLQDRFGLQVAFDDGGILYKETITDTVEGVGHYEPLRHYAEVHLCLEPLPRGSGLRLGCNVPPDTLAVNWQRLILTHLYEKTHLGVLTGSPITDMRITLIAGKDHLKHTEGGDFRQATYRAVRNGLMKAGSVLLEPWYAFELLVPQDCLGRAMNDLQRMNAVFTAPVSSGTLMLLHGRAPVSAMRAYPRQVTAYTGGRGRISLTGDGYEVCPDADHIIRAIGYDPQADLENSPDSVFCSHGAGFTVAWNRVEDFMHIATPMSHLRPGAVALQADSVTPAVPFSPAASEARPSFSEDKELRAIFERTYGPIRSNAMDRTPKQVSPPSGQTVTVPETEYLLVDGYNVIFAWEELKSLAKQNLDSARTALAEILCNFQGMRTSRVILVFDAYKVKRNPGRTENYKNIRIVYTGEAETADSYIEKASYSLKGAYRARVVTSDSLEQTVTMGHGCLRTSAREFEQEVKQANIEIARFIEAQRAPKAYPVAEAARRALEKK